MRWACYDDSFDDILPISTVAPRRGTLDPIVALRLGGVAHIGRTTLSELGHINPAYVRERSSTTRGGPSDASSRSRLSAMSPPDVRDFIFLHAHSAVACKIEVRIIGRPGILCRESGRVRARTRHVGEDVFMLESGARSSSPSARGDVLRRAPRFSAGHARRRRCRRPACRCLCGEKIDHDVT